MTRRYWTIPTVMLVLVLVACVSRESVPEAARPAESTYSVGASQLQHGHRLSRVQAARVTAEFFTTLNQLPWLGRTFIARDFEAQDKLTLVLSKRFWQDELGGSPDVIGQTLQLNGRDHTVIGVMPPDIEWPPGTDLWVPRLE